MKTGADLLCILSLSFLFSCASLDKLIDSGNFDTALNKATRKIIGKERIREKYVRAAEEAFSKVMEEDLDLILRLERSHKSTDHAESIKSGTNLEEEAQRATPQEGYGHALVCTTAATAMVGYRSLSVMTGCDRISHSNSIRYFCECCARITSKYPPVSIYEAPDDNMLDQLKVIFAHVFRTYVQVNSTPVIDLSFQGSYDEE